MPFSPLAEALLLLAPPDSLPGLYMAAVFCTSDLALSVRPEIDFESRLLGVLFNVVFRST